MFYPCAYSNAPPPAPLVGLSSPAPAYWALHVQLVLVDTLGLLDACLCELATATEIAVDCEGVDLCRNGRLCLIQLFVQGSSSVWVVDVTTLDAFAFDYVASNGISLRTILESPRLIKLFYDCRNDADALISLYGIMPAGIIDLQLVEVMARRCRGSNPRLVWGLSRALQEYLPGLHAAFEPLKKHGQMLFAPDRGGSYAVFEARPLDNLLLRYAAQDVLVLAILKDALGFLGPAGARAVVAGSDKRVAESALRGYVPNGRHKALVDHGF